MSTQSLTDFRAQISADETLQKLLREALAQGAEGIVNLAAERGFSITADDLAAASEAGDLSDAELELVAGGAGGQQQMLNSMGKGMGNKGGTH